MGRPERPLDPNAGPVGEFAARLRALRHRAGTPGYRELSRRTNYSVTTLSDAAGGQRLPSLAVTLAFVAACGGDVEAWRRDWQEVYEACQRSGAQLPPEREPEVTTGEPATAPKGFGWRTLVAVAAAAALTGAAAASALERVVDPRERAGAPDSGTTGTPSFSWRMVEHTHPDPAAPGDGMDPGRAGCAPPDQPGAVVSLDSVPVLLPSGAPFGELVLRHSSRCRVSWGRVTGPVGPERHVHITAYRPDDATATVSDYGGRSPDAYGWVLSTRDGCVYVEAFVRTPEGDGPVARTRCF